MSTGFELSISARDDGTVQAVYIRFDRGQVAETREVERGLVMADYDAGGRLLGIEVLGPVQLSTVTQLVDAERRQPFDRFVNDSLPASFRRVA